MAESSSVYHDQSGSEIKGRKFLKASLPVKGKIDQKSEKDRGRTPKWPGLNGESERH